MVAVAEMGTVDILEAGRGAVIAPAQIEGYADTVTELLADPARRAAMAAEGPAYVTQWSAPLQAARLAELYASLIAQHPARRAAL